MDLKKRDLYNPKNTLYPKQELESEDDDSWQVSYLDIITILLGFLIILLSISSLKDIESFSVSDLFSPKEDETEFIITPIERIKEQLEALLAQEIGAGQIEIFRELNDLRIIFRSDDLYQSGSAEIQDNSKELLNRVLTAFNLIEYNDFEIDVEGHTDNVPITTATYPSNWELSTARASNVVKYFNENGIEEERLKASGYASSRPVIEFDDLGNPVAASKNRNRRVVLRLFYSNPDQISSDNLSNSDLQQTNTESEIAANNNPDGEIGTGGPVSVLEENLPRNDTSFVSNNKDSVPANPEIAQKDLPASQLTPDADGCLYSTQIGEYESFARSIRAANRAESLTGYLFEIVYNNYLFSVRSSSAGSFSQALNQREEVKNGATFNVQPSVVKQCHTNETETPKKLGYIIQLGFFQNEQNAINFKRALAEEHNIDAKIKELSLHAYQVYAGTFNDRRNAQQKTKEFNKAELLSNVFIKYDPETVSNYSFEYQLIAGSYSSKTEASQVVQELQNKYQITSEVVTKENGNSYVITEKTTNRDLAQTRRDILLGTNLNLSPVIYLSEVN